MAVILPPYTVQLNLARRLILTRALRLHDHCAREAARQLGMSPSAFFAALKRLKIRRPARTPEAIGALGPRSVAYRRAHAAGRVGRPRKSA